MERLSVKETAAFLKVSEKTVYRWIRQGVIPTTSSQGRYRFNRRQLEAWARYKRIGGDTTAPADTPRVEEGLDLVEAIAHGGVFHDLKGKNLEELFTNMVDLLPFGQDMAPELRETLIRELVERESLVSTGIGEGVALPHPRHPREWGFGTSAVAIFFLKRPMDFKAVDDKPVFVLALLLCQTVKTHLKMLSQLAHMLKDDGLNQFLTTKPTSDDLMEYIQDAQAGNKK